MGEYGDRGFTAHQGKEILLAVRERYGNLAYELRAFICYNIYDIWNTDDIVFLDGCFFGSIKNQKFSLEPTTTIYDISSV